MTTTAYELLKQEQNTNPSLICAIDAAPDYQHDDGPTADEEYDDCLVCGRVGASECVCGPEFCCFTEYDGAYPCGVVKDDPRDDYCPSCVELADRLDARDGEF